MKKIKSSFLEDNELEAALDAFVMHGILIRTLKNGVPAWENSPEFDKKSKLEQEKILSRFRLFAVDNFLLASAKR